MWRSILRRSAAFARIAGLLAFSAWQLGAQYQTSAGQGPPPGTTPPPATAGRQTDTQDTALGEPKGAAIVVHVVLEDGAALSVPPLVTLPTGSDCRLQDAFLSGTVTLRATGHLYVEGQAAGGVRWQQTTCVIWRLSVPGYQTFQGMVWNGGTIKLHRLGEHEGAEVSLTTLSAPAAARKAYDRGEAAMIKKKWPEAEKHFEEALAIYPAYAPAWSELGTALTEQNRLNDAMNALQKSRSADPKYIKPIVQMAGVQGRQERWQEELKTTDAALAMHPVSFPGAYYYHAEACYHLDLLEEAAHAVHTAIETDLGLEFPQAHFLAGLVLAKGHQRSPAVQEFQLYLQMAPKGEHAAEAKAHIAELTRLEGAS